ncbi:PQQ-binding-like beta-propeller repeat protein [Stieleria maiorica]|nr:PQQ-binding-like beta-propeller repeat protein [Stieleria maiorica]
MSMKPLFRILSTIPLLFCFCSLASCDQPSKNAATGETSAATATASANHAGDFDWPRLLGKNFDGVAETSGIELDWTETPEVIWRLPVGDGYGLGCVVDGRYYHADAVRSDQPLGQRGFIERLRAFDLKDGRLIWSVDRPLEYRDMYGYETGPRGTPASDGKSILTFGCDGELCCRDITDGSLKWSVSTNQEYGVVQNFFGVGSSPLILDSMVIVPVGGSPAEDQQIAPGRLDRVIPNGSALVAFDLAGGDQVWKCGDDLASYSSPRPMKIGDKTVVLLFARNHLLAVDPEAGKVLWKQPHRADILESVNAMMPVVDGDRVFISECYQVGSRLMKVTPDGANTLWLDPPRNRRAQAMRCHWSTPVLVDGFLYGCSGRNNPDSDFRCVELATGKVRWSDDRGMRTSVTRAGEHLIVLDEYGRLEIVRPNPEKLEILAEYDFGDQLQTPCWAAPILVGDSMLIRGDGHVLCLAIATR